MDTDSFQLAAAASSSLQQRCAHASVCRWTAVLLTSPLALAALTHSTRIPRAVPQSPLWNATSAIACLATPTRPWLLEFCRRRSASSRMAAAAASSPCPIRAALASCMARAIISSSPRSRASVRQPSAKPAAAS